VTSKAQDSLPSRTRGIVNRSTKFGRNSLKRGQTPVKQPLHTNIVLKRGWPGMSRSSLHYFPHKRVHGAHYCTDIHIASHGGHIGHLLLRYHNHHHGTERTRRTLQTAENRGVQKRGQHNKRGGPPGRVIQTITRAQHGGLQIKRGAHPIYLTEPFSPLWAQRTIDPTADSNQRKTCRGTKT